MIQQLMKVCHQIRIAQSKIPAVLMLALAGLFLISAGDSLAAKRDRSFFQGMWIDSTSYNEIWRTFSLYSSRNIFYYPFVLEFKADTTELTAHHDGIPFTDSVLVDDTLFLRGPDGMYPLALRVENDSTLVGSDCVYDSNVVFRKVSWNVPAGTDYYLEIEKRLFEDRVFVGNWKIKDVLASKTGLVTLHSDRRVVGLLPWCRFAVEYGGLEGLPDFDNLILSDSRGHEKFFVYEAARDSISIYELLRSDGKGITKADLYDGGDFSYFRGRLLYLLYRESGR